MLKFKVKKSILEKSKKDRNEANLEILTLDI